MKSIEIPQFQLHKDPCVSTIKSIEREREREMNANIYLGFFLSVEKRV